MPPTQLDPSGARHTKSISGPSLTMRVRMAMPRRCLQVVMAQLRCDIFRWVVTVMGMTDVSAAVREQYCKH
ncbi:hypothetical protein AK812_SmicGene16601 [Symbiodinium microadriaticum]|uniref:Uncharacterized protein n=1 Tax=Symbiodinium microadriaticum TaxID=2951 RepID=A0A1Q9DZU8_SYMMI|nr:hypothetical protein AK812_SmicGene16601 [Symbiodinium microadriaticum]